MKRTSTLPRIDHLEGHVMRAWIDNGTLTVVSVGAENVYAHNEFGMEFYAKDVPGMDALREKVPA
jgi:hypothetical protein